MPLPISAKSTYRIVLGAFRPEARAAAEAAGETDLSRFDDPPAFIVAVPTVMQRAAWRRDILATGAKMHSDEDLRAELRRQVAAAFDADDPDRDRLLGVLDEHFRGDAPPEVSAEAQRIEETIHRSSQAYAGMMAERAYFLQVAPILACQHFLKARENPDHIFHRRNGLVSEADLGTLTDGELIELGNRIMAEVMTVSRAAAGNSASPSPSPGGQETSPAAP